MSWDRVRGHEAQAEALDRAWQRDRLAHAYLFVGPDGVGKRLFAIELAKALLCEGRSKRLEACDQCPACAQVEAGTHPDFFTAGRPEESLELPISVMRELCARVSLRSARGKGKVVLLDDADDLNEEAANCFLKTLEEPPPGSVLILLGTSPERQLPTVVSRCQVVRFAPLPETVVVELLRGQGVEEAQLTRLARLGGGSPGQALALADPALWEFRQQFLTGLAQPRPDALGLTKSFQEFVEEAGKESALKRGRAALVLRLLLEFLDDALRVAIGGVPRSTEPELHEALRQIADRLGPDRLLAVLERCLGGDEHIERRVQLDLVLEAFVDAVTQKLRG